MRRWLLLKTRQWIIAGIFLLALVGLGSSLFHEPVVFLKRVLIAFIFAAVLLAGMRFLLKRSTNVSNQEQKAFLKAARKSRKRMKKRNMKVHTVHTVKFSKRPLRKKSNVQLTVIEGKKGKKKNRAVY
jgi:hypothetical protein